MIIRFFASSSKWPRLSSATGFQVKGRGGICGGAAYSSPLQKPKLTGTERPPPGGQEVEVKLNKIWLLAELRIYRKINGKDKLR